MSLLLQKTQKCLAKLPTTKTTRAAALLITAASKPLSFFFVSLPRLILITATLAILDWTSIYALLCLGQLLLPSVVCTRLDDQAMTVTAALLLTAPQVVIQLSLMALHGLGVSTAGSWQQRMSGMGWAVVSGALWCAMFMVAVDLGFRGFGVWGGLLAAVVI